MRVLLALLVFLAAAPLRAQDAATLVANHVFITGDQTLTAEGAVEVFYKGAKLSAARIVYDSVGDTLHIDGPITLTDGGSTVILADQADLSRDLADGVLQSARIVFDNQLQIAAVEMTRVAGRNSQLSKVVATSCKVCAANPVPLWEIRARRVVHDQQERQIYFDHAQFRVAGVPVFYIPRLRMPDPTLERATGFLLPSFRTSTGLGPGIKVPYFIAIGDSRDLTLTPYLSTQGTRTLEFRYRQAFPTGKVVVEGALTRDELLPGEFRGYLFADGEFRLPREYRLDLAVQAVTDPAYLLDYDITDIDRLSSNVQITRTRRNEHIAARLFRFQSIRAGEVNATLPTVVGDASYQRRFTPPHLGGEGKFRFELQGYRRGSTVNVDANGDGITDGRDVARATAYVDWRRNWILENGIVVSGGAEVAADFFSISQDAAYPGTVTRLLPSAAIELRWPWAKSAPGGASHVIEPVVQVVWSPDTANTPPNEDSRIVEFDEGNLFAFSRFPGSDERERGTRVNLGVGWTRYAPEGWSLGVLAGRVFRADDLGQFGPASGLDGTSSDWLVATHLSIDNGLYVVNRALFDDAFSFSRDELQLGWQGERYDLSASYNWLVADAAEGRLTPISEIAFDAGWHISEGWRGVLSGRYDFEAETAAKAKVGLEYRNECAAIDLSLSRRFTSSTNVSPSTDFNLSVELTGFGGSSGGTAYRRSCIQ
ncbi:MAG: LPS-assembly protein LptD [Rhodobacteraceae bacterium]|nr:LPS-assembly protein LptD [Paracoccaceae bacterium]